MASMPSSVFASCGPRHFGGRRPIPVRRPAGGSVAARIPDRQRAADCVRQGEAAVEEDVPTKSEVLGDGGCTPSAMCPKT